MKTNFKLATGLIVLFFAFLSSCNHDNHEVTPITDYNQTNEGDDTNKLTSSGNVTNVALLAGTVSNTNGEPIQGALISTENATATTNENGYFQLENIEAPEELGFVTAEKEGYFLGSRSFTPSKEGNDLEITLSKKELVGSFNAGQGTKITMSSGDIITFPENAIKEDGSDNISYSGVVNVYAKALDVESENFLNEMPGDLIGVNQGDTDGMLYSYGMLYIELESDSGKKLNIRDYRTVNIKHPIPASMLASAPSEIPFWYFNESKGYWETYDTPSYKKGNYYEVEVPHFTKLNWDDWLKPCIITGTVTVPVGGGNGGNNPCTTCGGGSGVILPTNVALSGAYVKVRLDSPTGRVIASSKTNSMGSFRIRVPREFTNKYYIEVVNKPNALATTEILSAFKLTSETWVPAINLNEVVVNFPTDNFAQSIGVITDCNNVGIANKTIAITYRNFFKRVTVTNDSGFYGIVYATSNNIYNTINEKVNIDGAILDNTYPNNNKIHQVDFQVCTNTTFDFTLDNVNYTYTAAFANKDALYQGGIYLQASQTQATLVTKTQGVYLLLPNFSGKGTYKASVVVVGNVGTITNVIEENPSIDVTVDYFDGKTIKGSGYGTFNKGSNNINFNFELPYNE